MALRLKNAIIFIVIGGALILAYIFFFKGEEEVPNLISTPGVPGETPVEGVAPVAGSPQGGDGEFLSLLLNVRNIKLNDSILSDPAFKSLSDSTIVLTQDGTEGRPNPFAPLGSDATPTEEEEEDLLQDDSENSSASPSPAEKEVIIASIVNRQKIFSSGNPAQIRAYLKAIAPTPADVAKIDKESDKNILDAAKLVAGLTGLITETQLRSSNVEWAVTATTATLKIKKTDKGVTTTITITANKIGGKWY